MIDLDTRQAILTLAARGHGIRVIGRTLKLSRNIVRKVLRSGVADVPQFLREQQACQYIDSIRELYASCEGNIVRVHEELAAADISLPYSTLTRFCRKHGIGVTEKKPSGRYHFKPGQEMQHDTSPHDVMIGGTKRRIQCASVVLCYSRMIYAQCYPTFNRFWCKVFLTEGVVYFGGAAEKCMVDNTSVIVIRGSGPDAVFAAEMNLLGERFNFEFEAHAIGDANRSARVERPFHYIENNFYKGRTFADLADLNAQLIEWCDKVNARFKKHIRAKPIELFAAEKPALKPLPIHIPQVYELLFRIVDTEGYVTAHSNRYSVPINLISCKLELRMEKDKVRIFDGHKLVADHERFEDRKHQRRTLDDHRRPRRWRRHQGLPPLPEEQTLRSVADELGLLIDALKKHRRRRSVRILHRMYLDYPTDALISATRTALGYGMFDLKRIEKMVLQTIAGDFFRLPTDGTVGATPEDDNDG